MYPQMVDTHTRAHTHSRAHPHTHPRTHAHTLIFFFAFIADDIFMKIPAHPRHAVVNLNTTICEKCHELIANKFLRVGNARFHTECFSCFDVRFRFIYLFCFIYLFIPFYLFFPFYLFVCLFVYLFLFFFKNILRLDQVLLEIFFAL